MSLAELVKVVGVIEALPFRSREYIAYGRRTLLDKRVEGASVHHGGDVCLGEVELERA